MGDLHDPVKILARRFASLPPLARMNIAERLLRWRDEESASKADAQHPRDRSYKRGLSLLELFWNEVEAAHDDGLYPTNPFTEEQSRVFRYPPLAGSSGQRPVHT
ncbi:MAG: hypothetical protein ACRD9R_21515 [Pyrinomonadaceae bacterium]